MMQLCCTKKVRENFNIPDSSLHDPTRGSSTLGNWYLDLITIDSHQFLVCMSERTLLSFLLARNSTWANLGEAFVNGLLQLLQQEELTHEEFESALSGCDEITVTGATNEVAIASLSALSKHYQQGIVGSGGYSRCNLPEITSGLNRMPQHEIGGGHAIKVAKELIHSASGHGWAS